MPNNELPNTGVVPLMEPAGHQLHIGAGGHAEYRNIAPPMPMSASLSGTAPHYGVHPSQRAGLGGSIPAAKEAHKPQARKPTPEELMALAKQMEAQMAAQHQAQLAMGPAVSNDKNQVASLEKGVPPWLQDYMAEQAKSPPAHGPYNPPTRGVDMTPEERERYGANRPF